MIGNQFALAYLLAKRIFAYSSVKCTSEYRGALSWPGTALVSILLRTERDVHGSHVQQTGTGL
jgi:hypothetical protein